MIENRGWIFNRLVFMRDLLWFSLKNREVLDSPADPLAEMKINYSTERIMLFYSKWLQFQVCILWPGCDFCSSQRESSNVCVCLGLVTVIVLVKGILGRHDSHWAEHMCEIYVNGPVMQTSCVGTGHSQTTAANKITTVTFLLRNTFSFGNSLKGRGSRERVFICQWVNDPVWKRPFLSLFLNRVSILSLPEDFSVDSVLVWILTHWIQMQIIFVLINHIRYHSKVWGAS